MKFLRAITLGLGLGIGLLAAHAAFASVISNSSNGEFRPTSDFTLDLSGATLPQFSSIFIDAGIKLTLLTPTNGVFGDLLAANDIFVNGIIDAGNGNLNLLAGNQIVLGVGSQIFAGALNFGATTLEITGGLNLGNLTALPSLRAGATLNTGRSSDLDSSLAGRLTLGSGGSIDVISGLIFGEATISVPGAIGAIPGDLQISSPDAITVAPGAINLAADYKNGVITLATIPEPSSVLLLLLGGLALLATRKCPGTATN